jgi:peroxiredoxin
MEMSETREPDRPAPSGRRRGFLRTWVYPLAVIAIIVGVIWYIEYRPDGARSPSGELYGPADLPPTLVSEGAKVAAEEGALAPDFLLEQLEGPDVRLSDFRGKAVVLNFWATWCDPCRKEMPQFVRAYDEHKEHGLEIVAVNLQEGKAISQRFVDDYGMDFTVVVDRDGDVGDRYRVLGLPTTYFIDREGEIRSLFTGPFLEEQNGTDVVDAIDESELEKRIAEIMASPEAGG